MIEELKSRLVQWVEEYIKDTPIQLVDINITGVKYTVFVDTMTNITVKECSDLNRFLQSKLDVETGVPENYILDVSSPGMTNPLKRKFQFEKRLGKNLRFVMNDGVEKEGKLMKIEDDYYEIQMTIPKNNKTKVKEHTVEEKIALINIKKALIPIKF
jgi:ribosome maturation factor RimP